MFGLGTYFLWRQIKKAAGPYFDKKTKILLSNFKAAFSSTLTDLESAIVDESQSWHGGWTHDVIERQGGGKAESLDLRSVPLDVIEDSKAVAAALQVKLS